jgi:hypothetical protein
VPGEPALIGGELAAALATSHLRPARAAVHVPRGDVPLELWKALKLVPDPGGNVDALEHFGAGEAWSWPDRDGPRLAHPLLVHAEINREGADDRLRETARLLYDRYLAETFHDASARQRR